MDEGKLIEEIVKLRKELNELKIRVTKLEGYSHPYSVPKSERIM